MLCPPDWVVISNEQPVTVPASKDDVPFRTWDFRPTRPLSTYVTAVVAGQFHAVRARHRDIDLMDE